MIHMPVTQDPTKMLGLIREWEPRMTKEDFLFQAKGWIMTFRTWHHKNVFLPHGARQMGELVRELRKAAGFDMQVDALICGLTVRELDMFLLSLGHM